MGGSQRAAPYRRSQCICESAAIGVVVRILLVGKMRTRERKIKPCWRSSGRRSAQHRPALGPVRTLTSCYLADLPFGASDEMSVNSMSDALAADERRACSCRNVCGLVGRSAKLA